MRRNVFPIRGLWLWILLGGAVSPSLRAATCNSTKSGLWSDATAWSCGHSPGSADVVTVQNAHVITVSISTAASAVTVNNGGTLSFSRVASSTLTVSGGNITVNGTLDMGTSGNPIALSTVTAGLVLTSPDHGLIINGDNGGAFRAYGAAKSPVAEAITGAAKSATSLLVSAAQAAGWRAGDWITVGQTDNPGVDQTERVQISTITGTDPLTVSWTGGLSFAHAAGGPTRVGNLTRNVAVLGTGGSPGGILVTGASSGAFQAALAEFNAVNELAVRSGADGTVISSCSIHHAPGTGVSSLNANGLVLTNSLVYKSGNVSIFIQDSDDNLIRGNDVYSGNGFSFGAIYVAFGNGGNVVDGNCVYSDQGNSTINSSGLFIRSDNTLVTGNRVYANTNNGVAFVERLKNAAAGNSVYRNGGAGILVTYGAGQNLIASNELFDNGGGIEVTDQGSPTGMPGGDLFLANTVYNNDALYFSLASSNQEFFVQGGRFGYDKAGVSRPDNNEVSAKPTSVVMLRLRDVRINPAIPMSPENFLTQPGGYLISYNQELATGTVKVYGDYSVSGATMTVDYAQGLYASSSTAVRLLRGTGHSASVVSTDDTSAVTQLILIHCLDGTNWQVEGSESGVLYGPFTGALVNQNVGGQFNLTFSPGGSPQAEDRLAFGLMAGSRDAGVQKKLLFGSVDPGLNGGKTRLSVAAGAGLSLTGTPSSPAVVDRISSGDNFYTLISSGAFTLVNAQVKNADKDGVQLSGSGGVLLSSSTFDFMGVTAGQANAYITARSLTSNTTFYGIHFDAGRSTAPASSAFNVRVQGTDAGLSWYFVGHAGNLSGSAFDSDVNNKVNWAESVPPATPGAFAGAAGTNEGEVRLTWTSPGDDGAVGNIVGGSFLIYKSTVASQAQAAAPGQAQTVISTSATPGSAQAYVVTGLSLATSYYFRLWAGDEVSNYSALPAATTSQARRVTPQAVTGFTAAATANQVLLTWSDPPAPPAPYQGSYQLDSSSVSAGGPFSSIGSVPALATSYTDTGLQFGVTYYYRMYTTDLAGGAAGTSTPAAAQARTNDLPAPLATLSVGPRTVGVDWAPAVTVTFNKQMAFGATSGAVTLTRLKDRLANTLTPPETVSITVSSNAAGTLYTVDLGGTPLQSNSLYELAVSTAASDAFGKVMASSATLRFTTCLDHTVRNVVSDGTMGAMVDIPPLALAADGYLQGVSAAGASADGATRKLVSATEDPVRRPLGGSVVSLDAFDTAGAPQAASFGLPVTLSFPYADSSPADGIVDGSNPPARVRTLAVYWLENVHDLWVRLPSTVDAAAQTVSARTPHFTTFAVLPQADTDLSAAYAFPSPYLARSAPGGVTFTGLGQVSTVRLYTAEGELVREASVPDGQQQWGWDVKDADGDPVPSGVYYYKITSGSQTKAGKLAVIR